MQFRSSEGIVFLFACALAVASMTNNPKFNLWLGFAFIALGCFVVWDSNEKLKAKTAQQPSPAATESPLPPKPSLLGPEDPPTLRKIGFTVREYSQFNRWEREKSSPEEASSFTEIEVIIAREGQRVAVASVFDVHRDCAWRAKEPDQFVYESNASCELGEVLAKPKYQERLSAATDVVYIGMESFPDSPVATACHGTLSSCRAYHLANISHEASPDDWAHRRHWALDLGTATINDRKHEFDQRRAIVIGLRERRSEQPASEVVRDIIMSTRMQDVDLSAYSGAKSAQMEPLTLVRGDGKPEHVKAP